MIQALLLLAVVTALILGIIGDNHLQRMLYDIWEAKDAPDYSVELDYIDFLNTDFETEMEKEYYYKYRLHSEALPFIVSVGVGFVIGFVTTIMLGILI